MLGGRSQVDAGDGVGGLGASAVVLDGRLPRPHVDPRRLACALTYWTLLLNP